MSECFDLLAVVAAGCGAAALMIGEASPAYADEAPAPTVTPTGNPIAPSTPIVLPTIPGDTGHFEFGSYGRVIIASVCSRRHRP